MKLLDDYFEIQQKIHDYFDYHDDWKVIPLNSYREFYWYIVDGDESSGDIRFSPTKEELKDQDGDHFYQEEIFTYRHLEKYVYRAKDYTLILIDTHCDGNIFAGIFSNEKEVDWEEYQDD